MITSPSRGDQSTFASLSAGGRARTLVWRLAAAPGPALPALVQELGGEEALLAGQEVSTLTDLVYLRGFRDHRHTIERPERTQDAGSANIASPHCPATATVGSRTSVTRGGSTAGAHVPFLPLSFTSSRAGERIGAPMLILCNPPALAPCR